MDPVVHDDWRVGLVIICAGRSVDCERSHHTVGILRLVVRMVPGVSDLVSTERVGERVAVRNGTCLSSDKPLLVAMRRGSEFVFQRREQKPLTLSHTIDAIVLIGLKLSDTMPMHCGPQIGDEVGDVHYHLVTLVGLSLQDLMYSADEHGPREWLYASTYPASLQVRSRIGRVKELCERLQVAIRSNLPSISNSALGSIPIGRSYRLDTGVEPVLLGSAGYLIERWPGLTSLLTPTGWKSS